MKQVSLVSLYGEKKNGLSGLITQCQDAIKRVHGGKFTPYDPAQIHGTIIGFERRGGSGIINANFAEFRGREVEMDFDGFLKELRDLGRFPLAFRFGGFSESDRPFTSRNPMTGEEMAPYERSFSVLGHKAAVLGWEIDGGGSYPRTLSSTRESAERHGILHRYHPAPGDKDNDLYIRIGLAALETPVCKSRIERELRRVLSEREPLIVEIGLDDLFVAAYEDDRLPQSSTKVWSLADPTVTGGFIASLFD